MYLHIFQANLRLTRLSKAKERKSPLEAVLGPWPCREGFGETLKIFITARKDRAQEMEDFKVLVV
jgi:hypothetical protein